MKQCGLRSLLAICDTSLLAPTPTDTDSFKLCAMAFCIFAAASQALV